MSSTLSQFARLEVVIELTGNKKLVGLLVDIGSDILVLYDGLHYLYIPFPHVKHLKLSTEADKMQISSPSASSPLDNDEELSYRKVLTNAKGIFTEIYVTGNQQMHGYITNVLTNYFVFYSPVYKTMFIPLFHLKWLVPYTSSTSPYSLDNQVLPDNPAAITLSQTIEEQLKKLEGKLIILDLGTKSNNIGLLNKVEKDVIELITAEQTKLYFSIQHIKTVHSPNYK